MKTLFKLFSILLLLSSFSFASQPLHLEWGLGLDGNGKITDGVKYLLVSKRISGRIWDHEYGGGYWFDSSHIGDQKSSAFAFYTWGLEPHYNKFYVHYFLGPAIISTTDSRLGSNLQVIHEVAVGFKDVREVRLGICYRHLSNAGIVRPNLGRDFLGFQVEW